ncbi:MAG: KH domain-containing protein, partial [Flammeovirgaceae bacterium]
SVQNWTNNVNPNILHTLNDTSKIKRKIFIPKMEGVNFVGLLLGPKGCYQKRLEQQSGCKILIRGK